MATRQSQTDLVRTYINLIQEERRKIDEALESIAEYAEALHEVTTEARERLMIERK
jgi:Asp-tRNA(Asn)/Glu-tRNA(Gln) amidotransferase C subunit